MTPPLGAYPPPLWLAKMISKLLWFPGAAWQATSLPTVPATEANQPSWEGNGVCASLLSPTNNPLTTVVEKSGSRIRDRQRTVEHYWKGELPTRRQSVRDLAIQPTQRVMRYVLLYRDLLESTPLTSPSRALVERALEAATRIANKCDHAQGNAAFFHRMA
ncbi:hypothetical protein BD769DRAFT_556322 [Suillus cothurnatus]|nr:hypothetical protein BD769DRAFT_556322 [Suillus cothurnatus]